MFRSKTPGGFLFNGARRGSAPAVWFINGSPTPHPRPPAPSPGPRPPPPPDGLDGRRELFVAQTILSSRDVNRRIF